MGRKFEMLTFYLVLTTEIQMFPVLQQIQGPFNVEIIDVANDFDVQNRGGFRRARAN